MNIHAAPLLLCLGLAAALPAQETKPEKPTSRPTGMSWTGVLDEKTFASLHELKSGEAPALRGEDVEVGGATCYLARPEKPLKPSAAILVIHEWWGLNDHIKHWCDRLAADGYSALAVDLYGGKVATTREEASAAMQAVDPEAAREILAAAHRFLAQDPRVEAERRACIGWCFGGGWSLQHAITADDLDAAVVYYGRLETDPKVLESIDAPVLGVFGNQDRGIPPSAVDEFEKAMKAADNEVRILRYDANHAFANPSSARYDQENAKAAWTEVRKFLRKNLIEKPAEKDEKPTTQKKKR